jgi:hypothetical protein
VRYATVGLGAYTGNLEIYMVCPTPSEEIVELLTVVAHYHITESILELNHIVNFGKPWCGKSGATHGYLSLPYIDEPDLQYFQDPQHGDVRVLWLVPIYPAERIYMKQHGVEAFESLLESRRFDYWNPNRPCMVDT